MDVQDRDRLTTAGELSAILAHEIKNPMNSIIINMEVLRSAVQELTGGQQTPPAQRAKKYLDVIEGEIKRLDKVIKGFLDFTTPTQNTRVRFILNPVIQSIAEFMSNELKQKKVSLALDLQPNLPQLRGSPDQLKQALLNLVINAMQALPDGGQVSIQTQLVGNKVEIAVKDSGPGIDERNLSKIFNPYFTTKAKGSGLGLTIVRRVVKEHGGEIRVESKMGEGTAFILSFLGESEL